jgi:hypothetical protein
MEYKYYKVVSQLFFKEAYYYRVFPDNTYDWWDEETESWEGHELGCFWTSLMRYEDIESIKETNALTLLVLFGKKIVE